MFNDIEHPRDFEIASMRSDKEAQGSSTPWMDIAKGQLGVSEGPGESAGSGLATTHLPQ